MKHGNDDSYDDAEELPSKSAVKREMLERQALGEALCQLSDKQLAKIPIEDAALHEAILESRRIHSHSAARRHRQFIGKLMRHIDPAPLQAALDALHQSKRDDAERFHELEALRDRLLKDGDRAITDLLRRFPDADRQHLRQLLRQARSEAEKERPPAASRRLFRYLRELQESD